MEVIVNKHQSKIMDFLWMPDFGLEATADFDLSVEERQLFSSVLEARESLKKLFSPYMEKIERYFLRFQNDAYVNTLYLYLLEQGKDPQTLEECYELLLGLSEDILKEQFYHFMSSDEKPVSNDQEFLEILDSHLDAEGKKWRLFWASQHLPELIRELVSLYRVLTPIYQPFYERVEPEIDTLIANLDVFEFYKDSVFDVEEYIKQTKKTQIQTFVFSPYSMGQMFLSTESRPKSPAYIYLSPGGNLLLRNRQSQGLTKDSLDMVLKTLSDPVRYEILIAVTSHSVKNKDLAKQLGITAANVSFHIQKLVNAGLMTISVNDLSVKYQLNQRLLTAVLDRLTNDFKLDEIDKRP